jgi:glycosyltransferase involved in cell wall biosynthesis
VKVAYLTNQYPKTSHTFIRREIAGIEAAGLEVERFTIRRCDEALVEPRDREERVRTHVLLRFGPLGLLPSVAAIACTSPRRFARALRDAVVLALRSRRGLLRHVVWLAEACLLRRWTRRLGVEHVHAHFSTNPAVVALLCRELGGPPFSFTTHGGHADFDSPYAGSLPMKIARASFVVAICEDGRRRLRQRAPPGHERKIHVVRCGVDGNFLRAPPKPAPSAPRLVCVARLEPVKGIPVLLRAARLLVEEGVPLQLALIGDGPDRAQLETLSIELDLASNVHFEGWRSGDEVRARLLDSRALVLSSHCEGLPVVIMEALALRRPVISTDVGGIAELVVHGECGWIVPPGSERDLAEAMRDALAREPRELDVMGRAGAARVVVAHNSETEARTLAHLFLHRWPQRSALPRTFLENAQNAGIAVDAELRSLPSNGTVNSERQREDASSTNHGTTDVPPRARRSA